MVVLKIPGFSNYIITETAPTFPTQNSDSPSPQIWTLFSAVGTHAGIGMTLGKGDRVREVCGSLVSLGYSDLFVMFDPALKCFLL